MILHNKDLLIRLRYAMNIKDIEVVKIFKLGGVEITIQEVESILNNGTNTNDDLEENENEFLSYAMLNSFLNGYIIYKRGEKETRSDQERHVATNENMNNLLLKKLKVALKLTSEEMIDIFKLGGISISKSELSAVLRKEGHRNYKPCGDRYVRNFLKSLSLKYSQ